MMMKDKISSINLQRIQEIEERIALATAGPWKSIVEGRDQLSGSSFICTAGDDIDFYGVSEQDQDFMAAARQDIPYLIAEIKRLLALSSQPVSFSENELLGGNISSGIDLNKLRNIEQCAAQASEGSWLSVAGEPLPSPSLSRINIPRSLIITPKSSIHFLGIATADREFIAHARQDIPYLLLQIENLACISIK